MANVLFELDRLRTSLINKGIDANAVETIVARARDEIHAAFETQGGAAMELAVEQGVEKRSADFINDLTLDPASFELKTITNDYDYSTPPYPMLHKLLQSGAKPLKDGSGVYKVIPVGQSNNNRPKVSTSIYDSLKRIQAERVENARAQYQKVAPKGSKAEFRTATSKQNAATQWVQPAQEKDFSEEVHSINSELSQSMESIIQEIIQSYEDNF